MKLFLVTLKGLSSITGMSYHSSYVVAEDPTQAYLKIRNKLDKKDYGFKYERELDSIKLLADTDEYSDVRTPLFL